MSSLRTDHTMFKLEKVYWVILELFNERYCHEVANYASREIAQK